MTRVVVLGGGFGGAAVAAGLERLGGPEVHVTVVDRENFSLFTPLLPEVPSGALEPKHIVSPLRARLRRTVVRQSEVHAVDLERRVVVAGHCGACGAQEIPYDHLVIALGAVTNFFGLPGVAGGAFTLKSLADATSLHAQVIRKFEHADLEPDARLRRELLTFVVAGGGFAGVEGAAELNDFVRAAGRYYRGIRREDARVVLVHPGRRILPEVTESLSAYALRKLASRGVEVFLGTRIEAYEGHRIRLSTGQTIPSDTLIWTAGLAPNPIVARLDLPRTESGRLRVEPTLRVAGRPDVWAIGDCAGVLDPASGRACPPTAQHAIRQGRRLAENIVAALNGRPARAFAYRPLGMLASLGRRSAVAEILGLRFSGFAAWWLWRTVYVMKLPGADRKVRVALDWTLDLVFPRDIVYLRPLHLVAEPAPDAHGVALAPGGGG